MIVKKIIYAFSSLLFITLFFLIVFGRNGYMDLNRFRQEHAAVTKTNMKLEQENHELYRTIERLKNDPEYIENIARQEFGMIGKDELILKIKGEK